MQDGCLLLALAYKRDFAANRFYGREELLNWSQWAVEFWARSLHRDGSGDEMYPNERSFCATAFSTAAATETLLLVGGDPPPRLLATARWLGRQGRSRPANQLAAAALALQNIFSLLGAESAGQASEEMVLNLLNSQTEQGYFDEYGGYDLGYLSITLSFLARLHMKTGQDRIWEVAQSALVFLERLVSENGSYDIAGTSRGTQFLYPLGLSYFASDALRRVRNGLRDNSIINPSWMDDRYVIPMTIDYLQAHCSDQENRDGDGATSRC